MVTLMATALTAKAAEVNVTGTILPGSCNATISNGGSMHYGPINAKQLSPTHYTVLQELTTGFSISCDAPTKVAVRAINGRPDTAPGTIGNGDGQGDGGAPVDLFGLSGVGVAGLGLDNQNKAGGYGIQITPGKTKADGNDVDSLSAKNTNEAWTKDNHAGNLYDPLYTRVNSWGATGTLIPIPFTTLTGTLSVQAYLNKSSELNLTKPIAMDGLTTIEMVYL